MSIIRSAAHNVLSFFTRAKDLFQFIFRHFRINSIKFKVSVLYTVVLGVILVVFCVVLHAVLSYYLYQDIDTRLRIKALETLSTVKSYAYIIGDKPDALNYSVRRTFFYDVEYPISLFDMGKIKRLESRWQERADVLGLSDNYMAYVSSDKQQVIVTKNFPSKLLSSFLAISNFPNATNAVAFNNIYYKGELIRVITVPYSVDDKQQHFIHIGVSQRPVDHLLRRLSKIMAISVPLVLLLTSFIGLIFVIRILDPIEEIAKTASKITHEDLSLRVKDRHLDSEIQYLVDSFNDMIERLERSFKHIDEFSSHVAHELKTPLAIIKGESEVILSKERGKEEYKNSIRINLEEANRMRKTIEDLLLLARLDYQPDIFKLEPFDFTEFFTEICEQARILAAEKELTVKVSLPHQKVIFKGDKLHLRRLFFNLIDNAMKFTSPLGEIRLDVVRVDKKLTVYVSDTGAGIPSEDISKIFEKFYQIELPGMEGAGGTGLGLSIVHAIVKIHHGTISVKSKVGLGTTFQIVFPLV